MPGLRVNTGPAKPQTAGDDVLVSRLRAGEEEAFVLLAARHQAAMLRLASTFVGSTAVAEEVVQDTWLAVLRGIDGFAGRSSFKTWLLAILVNRARSTACARAAQRRDRGRRDGGRPLPLRRRRRLDVTAAALGRGQR